MTQQTVRSIHKSSTTSRRDFLRSTVVAVAAAGSAGSLTFLLPGAQAAEKKKKVVIAGHPWVYAAPLPEFDPRSIFTVLARGVAPWARFSGPAPPLSETITNGMRLRPDYSLEYLSRRYFWYAAGAANSRGVLDLLHQAAR